jgi:hypothetical protein
MRLLALWLILTGLLHFVTIHGAENLTSWLLPVLALAAGVLLLLDR